MTDENPQGLASKLYAELLSIREYMLEKQKAINELQQVDTAATAEELLNREIQIADRYRCLEKARQHYERTMHQYLDARG